MPHSIKIDDAKEHLFLLRNLAYAAGEYARRHDLTVEPGIDLSEHETYFPWITAIVGDRLLDVALITRMTHDLAREECDPGDADAWDQEATAAYLQQSLTISDVKPSVREASNKIIHAKAIYLDRTSNDGGVTEEWNGRITLTGTKGTTNWTCSFEVPQLCSAIEHFLELASENIDWFDVYAT